MFSFLGRGLVAFSDLTNIFLGDDKLHFKSLTTERDYSTLQRSFEEADGIRLPVEYLKQGRAFVCFDDQLKPQGGFALIDKGPFRSLEQIPDDILKPVETAMTEITAVCLNRSNALRRTRYWSYVVGQTLCGHSERIVYAVDSDKTSLREQVFNHIRVHTLYEGPVKKLEGMDEEAVEAVELTTKSHLTKGFLKLALNEAGKIKSALEKREPKLPRLSRPPAHA